MIESLTPEQTAKMSEYTEKWLKIGINTDRLDYDETVEIIHKVQTHLLKTENTPVIIVNNPVEAWVACHYLKNGVEAKDVPAKLEEYFVKGIKMAIETYTTPYLNGSFDANVWSFYDFFRDEVGIDFKEASECYEIWHSTHKLGQIYPMPTAVVVSQKPTVIHLNEDNVTHCDGGPAIAYDGYGLNSIFILNGTRVPEWLAVTPSNELTLDQYNTLDNADHKMEFVRKFGVERMLSFGKKIDSYENYPDQEWWTKSEYELWDMAALYPGIEYAPHLKMLNQTVGVWHVESVSPECKNLRQAIAERLGDIDLSDHEIVGIA